MSEHDARMGLQAALEPGSVKLAELVALRGVEGAWRRVLAGAEGEACRERAHRFDAERARVEAGRAGARYVIPGEEEWPTQLDALAGAGVVVDLAGPPLGLWVKGPRRLPAKGVAIVGARACTNYGETVANVLAGDLAELGVTIVSGGAYGIDAAAHRGALAAGGRTVAVLACGIDEVYPPGQAALLHRLGEDQLLVSEYAPGSRPTRLRFLARNRLIAALTDGTVLVEAAARSGARNTVNWAQRCGRVVMAVPGPVTSSLSYLPHQLLRDAEAVLVDDAGSVAAMVRPLGQGTLFDAEGETREVDGLPDGERTVLEALPARGTVSESELALLTGMRVPQVAAAVRALGRRGLASEEEGVWRLERTDASRRTGAGRRRRLA